MSRHSRLRFHSLRAAAAIAFAAAIVGAVAAVGAIPALAQALSNGAVQGRVVDQESGLAVAGAQVASADLGLSAVTGPSGGFSWPGIAVPSDGQAATIEVRAAGYGIWTIRDVPVFPDDTLILEIGLGPDPVDIQVPPPRSETPGLEPLEGVLGVQGAGLDQMNEPIPGTIRVRVTGYAYCDTTRPYTVQTVDFKDYVKHVLPNEWVSSWPGEALRAGAMAVKMYAWQIVASGGKWPDADVYDSTCDQVYLPSVSYASTNRAVDFTWNWRLTKSGALVRTSYRALYSQCVDAGKVGSCIAQWDTYYHSIGNNGYDKLTWDEMLYRYYVGTLLTPVWNPPGGFSLRYYGNGWGDIDRVKISIDNPARPADVGAGDFTLEWWMKATLADNLSTAVSCGTYDAWRSGNILLDRDIYGAGDKGDFGVSLSSGRLAFGAAIGATGTTVCGATAVANGAWHHVAVTRRASDGRLQIYVDGALDGEGPGPVGDMRYADGRSTTHPDDPFLVLGAEKHDAGAAYPSYNGFIDEMRLSANIRYSGPFTPPTGPYASDANTVALYHFNEGFGDTLGDVSGASGGPSHGLRSYGGYTNGPEWTDDSPWFVPQPTPTPYATPTSSPTRTPTPGASPTRTGTATATSTANRTPTQTPSGTATNTPSATATPLATGSASSSPTSTATNTASATATPLETGTAIASPTSTPTNTALATASGTASFTATSPPPTTTASPNGSPTPVNPTSLVGALTFQTVVGGLTQPVFVTHAGDSSGRLFVIERAGRVRLISASGTLASTPFLDITSIVGDSGSEQGLLGLTFHPAYETNGRFFVAYTNNSGAVVLARYIVSANASIADPASAQILLTIPKPAANHNGGMVEFGPDGYLYVSVGDGGGAGDTANNAQNRTVLLGKILRLDVDAAVPYAIPPDNPFIADPDPAVKREIWAYGLRNPWRFSFDRAFGDLYIGDVGQGSREEIDYEASSFPGGGNYGWRVMEGSLCFNPSTGCNTSGKILPVAEYGHVSGNCSVSGGYVYRGDLSLELRGVYLYGDFCSGKMWGLSQPSPGAWASAEIVDTTYGISSFGEDESGEIYLTDYAGGALVHILGPLPPATPTSTGTSTPDPTDTPTLTATVTPSLTPTDTPTLTATVTPSLSPTGTFTPTPTTPTLTSTVSRTPTIASSFAPTETPSPGPSSTPTPTATASSTSTSPVDGDVNQDGRVDIIDVQLCVNVILGTESDPPIVARADANGDGLVDVLDIQRIVNTILLG